MKSIILVALALAAVAVAAPTDPIPILKSFSDASPEGSYGFSFETGNGIARVENGDLKQVTDADNKPREVVVIRGSYSYISPEGVPVSITYSADENGYKAEGDSIPKARR